MISIKANLRSCVNDMTQQGKQALFENYFTRGFTHDVFGIKVSLGEDTFKMFSLRVSYIKGHNDQPESLHFGLYLDNSPMSGEKVYSGEFTITQTMTVLSAILCALHVCGDYIKFGFTPISEESEKNHNA